MTIAVTKSGVAALIDFTNYNVPALDLAGASLLVVGVTWQFGGNALAATYNGVAMSVVPGSSSNTSGTGQSTCFFYLINPPSGSNTLTFLPGPPPSYGFNNGALDVSYMAFTGTHATAPLGAVATVNQGSGTINTAISVVLPGVASTSSYVMMHVGWPYGTLNDPPTPILPSGMTELHFVNDTTTPSTGILFGLPTPAAGSNTLTIKNNTGTSFIDMLATEILPAASLNQTITAAPLVESYTLGTATFVVTGQIVISAAPVTATYTLGAATVSKPLVITAGPILESFSLGAANVSVPSVINPLAVVTTNAQIIGTSGSTYTSTAIDASGASLLLVEIAWSGGPFQVTPPTVSFGGQAMTGVAGTYKLNSSSNWARQIYQLAAPPSGAQVLSVFGSTGNMMTVAALTVALAGSVQGIGAVGVVTSSSTSVAVPLTGIAGPSSILLSFVNSDGFGTTNASFTSGWLAGAKSLNATSGGDHYIYSLTSPTAGAQTPTFTNANIDFLVMESVEVLGISAPVVTAGPVSATYSLGAATIQQSLAIGPVTPVTASYTLGFANVVLPPVITANPAGATYVLGNATVTRAAGGTITAAPLVEAYSLGQATITIPQFINAIPLFLSYSLFPATVSVDPAPVVTAQTIVDTYSLGAASVIIPPVVSASPLVGTFTLGAATVVQTNAPPAINAGPVSNTYSLGAATVSVVKTITATPVTATYTFGLFSASNGPVITAGPIEASYTLGAATVHPPSPTVTAGPVVATYSLGAFKIPPTVMAEPIFASYTLGAATVVSPQNKIITAGPVTAAYTLGHATVNLINNQSITASPVTAHYTFGSATFTTAFGAIITFGLTRPTARAASVQWKTKDGTATVANGDYVASSGTLQFPVGSTNGTLTIPVTRPAPGEPSKNFSVVLSAPVNLSLGPNPEPVVLTIAAGVPVTLGEFTISDGVFVTIAVPQTITATAVTMQTVLGAATVAAQAAAQLIVADPVSDTYALGAATVQTTGVSAFLSTNAGKIVNSSGATVILKTFNWYGMESNLYPALLSMNGSFAQSTIGRPYKTITWAGATQTNGVGVTITNGQTYEGVLDQMKRLGFNCIRIPLCQDITWPNAQVRVHNSDGTMNGINVNGWLNPDFTLTPDPSVTSAFMQNFVPGLTILDLIVAHCKAIGLYVMLDMHSLAPQDPINGNNSQANGGLWYTTSTPSPTATGTGVTNTHDHIGTNGDPRSELDMENAWVFLANRYKDNPAVALFDLNNEGFNGTWDNSATTGLPAFYERMAAAIQDPTKGNNQGVLIVCEGTKDPITFDSGADPEFPSFAGNLSGVATRPVVTTVPNKVVYSPHEYPQYNTGRFLAANFPASLDRVWDAMWGFIPRATGQSYQAPVIIGEFNGDFRDPATLSTAGTPSYNAPASQATASGKWVTEMSAYIIANGTSWAYFALNPPFNFPATTQNNYGEAMMDIQDWTQTDSNVMPHLTAMLAVTSA